LPAGSSTIGFDMSDNEIKYALGNYQRTRRIMIAVLVFFLFAILLVGQS
jgi:hypothetical protein